MHTCPRHEHDIARRLFLQGAVAGGATAYGCFGSLFSAANAREAASQQKHVILVFMSGGPSQFETWDPKPGRPTGGPHLTIPTAISGIHFDEFMPNLARLAGKMAVVRSMSSPFGQHEEGCLFAQTGHRPSATTATAPHWLSMCSRVLPAANPELPPYVMLGRGDGPFPTPNAGWLGAGYEGLVCPGNGMPPQDLPAGTPHEVAAFAARERLRRQVGQRFAQGRAAGPIASHDTSFQRIAGLLAARDLFDVGQEKPKDLERYGASALGRDCLLARRLVERGVSFVRVQHQNGGAWDKHRRAFQSQRYITTEFDTAVGALIDDLVARGLWERTLLVLMGEFGRTPDIAGQGPPGRNHWTKSWSLSFGGCGVKGGVVVGSTNADGTAIQDRPVNIPDLFATFYTALGLNPNKEIMYQDRPMPLVENKAGKVIAEAF